MKFLRSAWKWIVAKPFGLVISVFVIVGSIILLLFKKDLQIGGVLGSLLGSKKPDLRAVLPKNRTDGDGDAIIPGQSDDKGFTQAPVSTTIKKPSLFSDPNKIVIEHPEKGEKIISLPTGVKNKDVREVTEIKPDIYEIKNNDSGVNTDKILAMLD